MSELQVQDREQVRWIAIERPASKNALTLSLNEQLIEIFRAAAADSTVRAVVLTGRGGSFCTGLDLKDAMRRGANAQNLERDLRTYFHGLIRAVRAIDKPTIALVDGIAGGFGCDLALACDLRIATERAQFAELFVRRGLMPDGGGTFVLPRLVGVGKALEMMFTGDAVGGEEAVRLGLANRLTRSDAADAEVQSFAARLAQGPPLVYARIKRAVYAALEGSLEQALERECEGQVALLGSLDFAEGMAAFFEKREARFTGK
jgi:enoyl-CoA hydratase/carnithine racemase